MHHEWGCCQQKLLTLLNSFLYFQHNWKLSLIIGPLVYRKTLTLEKKRGEFTIVTRTAHSGISAKVLLLLFFGVKVHLRTCFYILNIVEIVWPCVSYRETSLHFLSCSKCYCLGQCGCPSGLVALYGRGVSTTRLVDQNNK